MAKYQVKEVIHFLGANSVGYFTGTITDYNWAKQQMETRFMKYVHEYKNNHPKVSMGRMSCKLTMDDGDFIEVTIQDLEKGGTAV